MGDERRCAVCGVPVRLLRADARFCSARCRVNWNRNRNMPAAMRRRPQWVRYDARKRPLSAQTGHLASVTDPASWSTWGVARDSPHGVGAGFVLRAGEFVIWDLDHALDADGAPTDWAAGQISQLRPQALLVERSLSGRGLHAVLPGDGQVLPCHPDPTNRHIERWTANRYVAMTGEIYR